MDIKEVKDLIQEILRSDISEFELEHTGTKIKLSRGFVQQSMNVASPTTARAIPAQSGPAAPMPDEAPPADNNAQDDHLSFVTSPIVGTFFRAPAPDAKPFVEIGQMIEEGTILCVVEAMKILNEIPADVAGEVIGIYAENNEPVEYGQKLFGIRTRK